MTYIRKKLIVFISILCSGILVSCSFAKKNTEQTDITTEVLNDTINNDVVKNNTVSEDSIIIPTFYIDVELTAKAKEIIIATKETIVVNFSISFAKEDFIEKSSFSKQIAEDGLIWLCSLDKEINFGETAKIDGLKIPQKLYNDLKIKEIWGFAQCYTGRKVFDKNLLMNTNFAEFDVLKVVSNEIFIINAKLIAE
jgi:hypothetical protein